MKRLFDIVFSFIGLILFLPFMILIMLILVFESKGGPFYKQERIGKNKVPFMLLKFRSMRTGSDVKSQITVGNRDPRITKMGFFLRKAKLDEIPQFVNILKGEMSFVGPRPEVPKYVNHYNADQLKALDVRPGLTDWASLEFINENELLGNQEDPESYYINEILPKKIELQLKYVNDHSISTDIKIILQTLKKIVSGN